MDTSFIKNLPSFKALSEKFIEVQSGNGHIILSAEDGKKYIKFTDGAAQNIILTSMFGEFYRKSPMKGVFGDNDDVYLCVETLKSKATRAILDSLLSGDNEAISTAKSLDMFNTYDFEGVKEVSLLDCLNYFEKDTIVVFEYMDREVAGAVNSISAESSMFGSYLKISCRIITIATGNPEWTRVEFSIPFFSGKTSIDNLPAKMATDESIDALVAKNKKLLGLISETTFLNLKGEMFRPSFGGYSSKYVDGRVVLDPVSLYEMDTNNYKSISQAILRSQGAKPVGLDNLTSNGFEDEEDYAFLLPLVIGFSLDKKSWGAVPLDSLEKIDFKENAFDTMVMDQSRKEMLLSIANSVGEGFSDIIDNKGGGSTILLHGDPGLGKTLTAEAMAEYLNKPLYKVSIGELGTDVDSLEIQLEKVLTLAENWDAILLIDEADIFMEERSTSDIQRNAMVTVFLRLLEYYSGILFLTTNRVKNIDPAFYSRITMALTFKEADSDTIKKIWTGLLNAAGIDNVNIDELLGYKVNGRQIKNAIIGARGIANFRNVPLDTSHIIEMLENNKKFVEDLASL